MMMWKIESDERRMKVDLRTIPHLRMGYSRFIKTFGHIRVKPEQLEETAKQFRVAHEQSRTMIAKLNIMLQQLEPRWSGMKSQKFYSDYQQAQRQFNQYLTCLQNIEKDLIHIAERFREADQNTVLGKAIDTPLGKKMLTKNGWVDISKGYKKWDRDKAVEYALKYAYATGENYPEEFRQQEHDCTNFVSQVLHAGGFPENEKWRFDKGWFDVSIEYNEDIPLVDDIPLFDHYTKTWTEVNSNFEYIKQNFAAEVIHVTNQDELEAAMKKGTIQKGDLIYWNQKGGKEPVDHATVVTNIGPDGRLKYSGHSKPRADRDVMERFSNGDIKDIYIVRLNDYIPEK
jgi:WXG100 family type VII secretion target